jgi:hypothetical protein
MIFDGARDDWAAHEASCHLDRLTVTGVLTIPRRARRPRFGELLGWLALPIVAIGFVAIGALVLR